MQIESQISSIINVPNILGVKTAIGFYLFYLAYSYLGRKKSLQIIKDNLEEDEVILFEPKQPLLIDLVAPLGVGGAVGVYILPFLIYKSTFDVDYVNKQNLFFFILVAICSLIYVLFTGAWKTIITNKKIAFQLPFKLTKKNSELHYTDIKSVILPPKVFGWPQMISVHFKDGTRRNILPLRNLEKIKSIIEEHINCEN
jgi:hypothetical protein